MAQAQRATSGRSLSRLDRLENSQWKATYFLRFGTAPLYRIDTEKPIVADSADHKWPHGTIHDNSVNRGFNLKLYDHFARRADLKVLDLGCAGGGFVRSVLADGYTAIGIEGSDISQRLRSGEWDTCPHHLFTADIAAPFQIMSQAGERQRFHCVTAWEVLEHIPAEKLPTLLANISDHLEADGIFVASVATFPDENPITGAVYHVTLQPREWWLAVFAAAGLVEVGTHPFTTPDYVRGHGHGLTDWDPADGDGFHLVMRRAA